MTTTNIISEHVLDRLLLAKYLLEKRDTEESGTLGSHYIAAHILAAQRDWRQFANPNANCAARKNPREMRRMAGAATVYPSAATNTTWKTVM